MSVPDLFEPLSLLHGLPMRNRFMLAPLTPQQSEHDGSASPDDLEWFRQLADSGYALVQTCATTLREGGAQSAVQLHHAGHRAAPELGGVPAPAFHHTVPGVRALTTAEVERIRDDFIAAAQRAERAGFDGVAVHGAFGWILSEFMSPFLDDRTDRYGGSTENRARLTLEVLDGIRRACGPDFHIGWRLSIERYGLQLQELREITADILDLALWDSAQVVHSGAFRGRTMLSVFTDLPRRGVRVGTAGRIMSAHRAGRLLEEGVDFVHPASL